MSSKSCNFYYIIFLRNFHPLTVNIPQAAILIYTVKGNSKTFFGGNNVL